MDLRNSRKLFSRLAEREIVWDFILRFLSFFIPKPADRPTFSDVFGAVKAIDEMKSKMIEMLDERIQKQDEKLKECHRHNEECERKLKELTRRVEELEQTANKRFGECDSSQGDES